MIWGELVWGGAGGERIQMPNWQATNWPDFLPIIAAHLFPESQACLIIIPVINNFKVRAVIPIKLLFLFLIRSHCINTQF